MSQGRGIWVGYADLDDSDSVTAVSGPARPDHVTAHVLIGVHGTPLGYVDVPLHPEQSLAGRAVSAAAATLAPALREHQSLDEAAAAGPAASWTAQVSCQRHFRKPDGAGISLIICTRDRPEELGHCLAALRRVSYEPVEILVVDNAPATDATWRVVTEIGRDDPRVRYTREPGAGLSRARNHGLTQAKFELLAFTDDDILVEPGWPTALAAGFAADAATACVTGPVAARSLETRSERYFDSRYPWAHAFTARRYDLADHRVDSRLYPFNAGIFGTGANFAVRRTVIDKLGGFDPQLGAGSPARGGEDLDMFVRIVLAGHQISYLPAALVWHQHRADDAALTQQVYGYGHGLGAYLAKRLVSGEMPVRALGSSAAHSLVIAGHMRRAARASDATARSLKLAATEAWGVVAGAAAFSRVSWQQRRSALEPGRP